MSLGRTGFWMGAGVTAGYEVPAADRSALRLDSSISTACSSTARPAPTAPTVTLTNLHADPPLAILGLARAFASVFAGGILFAALRLVTGHLGGSIVAQWVFNAALLVGLYTV